MGRLRTFIAVDVGKAIRGRLAALQETLARTGTEVKWVEPENLHVTLLFLGEVDERQIPSVCRLVAEETARRPGFLMAVQSAGCFPNPRRPRILWVGTGEGTDELVSLHDALEGRCKSWAIAARSDNTRRTSHWGASRVIGPPPNWARPSPGTRAGKAARFKLASFS